MPSFQIPSIRSLGATTALFASVAVSGLMCVAHAGPIQEAAAVLDGAPPVPANAQAACDLLEDTLGPAKAKNNVAPSAGYGIMSTPIACQRAYDTAEGVTLVSVYTEPRMVNRVAEGPPPGSATSITINGATAYVDNVQMTRLPGLIVDVAPAGVVTLAVDSPKASVSTAKEMVNAMDLAAFRKTGPKPSSLGGPREPSKEEQVVFTAAQQIQAAMKTMLAEDQRKWDMKADGPGIEPRCLDVGALLEVNPDFLYVSTVVGEGCVKTSLIANPDRVETIEGLRVTMMASEKSFDGYDTTNGIVELAPYAIFTFQADGDQSAALKALKKMDWSLLKDLL